MQGCLAYHLTCERPLLGPAANARVGMLA